MKDEIDKIGSYLIKVIDDQIELMSSIKRSKKDMVPSAEIDEDYDRSWSYHEQGAQSGYALCETIIADEL